jgi:hypothetical protein
MRVEQGKAYVLTFWAKSNRDGDFTVNCQQNHEPWAHPTQAEIPISTEWRQVQFIFVAAWDDDKVRITFTNLGSAAGSIYWFANCSLVPKPAARKTAAFSPLPSGSVMAPSAAFGWKGNCTIPAAALELQLYSEAFCDHLISGNCTVSFDARADAQRRCRASRLWLQLEAEQVGGKLLWPVPGRVPSSILTTSLFSDCQSPCPRTNSWTGPEK